MLGANSFSSFSRRQKRISGAFRSRISFNVTNSRRLVAYWRTDEFSINVRQRDSCSHFRNSLAFPSAHIDGAHKSSILNFSSRPDPFSRRPNSVCDPYEQGGQPLPLSDATRMLKTLDTGWQIEQNDNLPPTSIYREFIHPNYLIGAKFVHQMACVGEINNHYPIITLKRQLMQQQKAWQVVTTVKCRTEVLQGLSHSDFYLAMLIDAELARFNCVANVCN